MSTDLEQQLRETLQGRAATVHDGPIWDASGARVHRPNRLRWLPAAAAAGVVLLAAVGVAAWQADGGNRHAADGAGIGRPTCAATLPASWAAARASTPLTVDGSPAFPEAAGPNGSIIVDQFPSDGSSDIGLMAADGTTTRLIRIPPRRLENVHSDLEFAVVNSSPQIPADAPNRPVDDIAVVDIASGRVRNILARAPMPAGWVVVGHGAVIQHGIVYWGAHPLHHDEGPGIVISYDIERRTYRVLDHLTSYPDVEQDRRGVAWPGGSVPAAGVPSSVPPILNAAGDYHTLLVSDGSSYAWTVNGADPLEVHWADSAGHTKIFQVNPVHDSRFAPLVFAVSGPFVFMGLNGDGAYSFVLDTRTGALASTGTNTYSSLDSAELGSTGTNTYSPIDSADLFVSPELGRSEYRVDASALPELHC